MSHDRNPLRAVTDNTQHPDDITRLRLIDALEGELG
jgi:hypothetical protein